MTSRCTASTPAGWTAAYAHSASAARTCPAPALTLRIRSFGMGNNSDGFRQDDVAISTGDHSGNEASHTVAHRFSQLVGAGLDFHLRQHASSQISRRLLCICRTLGLRSAAAVLWCRLARITRRRSIRTAGGGSSRSPPTDERNARERHRMTGINRRHFLLSTGATLASASLSSLSFAQSKDAGAPRLAARSTC